jgi:hypothetical protein
MEVQRNILDACKVGSYYLLRLILCKQKPFLLNNKYFLINLYRLFMHSCNLSLLYPNLFSYFLLWNSELNFTFITKMTVSMHLSYVKCEVPWHWNDKAYTNIHTHTHTHIYIYIYIVIISLVHGTVHRTSIRINISNNMQLYNLGFYFNKSTCFGRSPCPSSGVHYCIGSRWYNIWALDQEI